jgi:hypothetical protein
MSPRGCSLRILPQVPPPPFLPSPVTDLQWPLMAPVPITRDRTGGPLDG